MDSPAVVEASSPTWDPRSWERYELALSILQTFIKERLDVTPQEGGSSLCFRLGYRPGCYLWHFLDGGLCLDCEPWMDSVQSPGPSVNSSDRRALVMALCEDTQQWLLGGNRRLPSKIFPCDGVLKHYHVDFRVEREPAATVTDEMMREGYQRCEQRRRSRYGVRYIPMSFEAYCLQVNNDGARK